ncbi:MAG: nicotinate (nicotinamide) nucleotide adenylyltransferase, partial [Lachnospiraceae bacterium]|nr:nicotinate (nicotinamide) nucleotide adenylyltransferase [Lachnospiraceae bacterium]
QHAYEELSPEKIIVIPAGHPYQKERKGREITPGEHRLAMLRAAISGASYRAEISTAEMEADGPSYTADTLDYFRELYPEADFYWLCGSDILFSITSWWRHREVLAKMILYVIPRGGDDLAQIRRQKAELEENEGARVVIAGFRGPEISSSKIRELLQGGDAEGSEAELRALLPGPVLEYIRQNGLYRDRQDA